MKHYMFIGVGIDWQRHCKTCQSLRELAIQSTVFFFFSAVTMVVIVLDHIVRGGEPYLRTRRMIASRSVNMVRHPRGSCIVIPIAVSGVATHQKTKYNSLALSSICKKVGTRYRSPSYERFLEGCNSPFMRLAEYLTALRGFAWCKQCLPGW